MRTKALLGLAALVVSAATCVAQNSNVYSLNIVGYVNVNVAPGLNLISNPLKPSDGNYNITNTISLPDAADGAAIFTWAGTGWDPTIPNWFGTAVGWDPVTDINLGEAFFLNSPIQTTITFVGEVQIDTFDYSLPPGISLVAPKTPVQQRFPGQDVGNDGDSIFLWTGTGWSPNTWTYFGSAVGWDGGASPDNNPAGPTIPVGGGLVYQNTGTTPLTWQRTFNPE